MRLISLSVLIALAPLCCVAQTPRGTGAEVKQAFDNVTAAAEKHDVAAFERLLSDDFVFVARTGGTFDRSEYLANQRDGRMAAGGKQEILSLRVYGDSAILLARTTAALPPAVNGSATPFNVISTYVFVKQNGVWNASTFTV